MSSAEGPILYVIVVGFHHKKGCQVEYSFPPLVDGSPNECPPGWKYLPTLALPDGSHNYDDDTVYFHLPSLTNPKQTVYGISCFRQIPVEKLKNRTSDITRGTVQKSVCVLSEIPLYGQIQVKMSLITHAYFEEGDFSKVSILEDTYHHLNSVLYPNDLPQKAFVGLSARDFVLQWKHKAVLLFKLLLLEKKVVFYKSPVHPLCSTILTLVSLYPDMIEHGLNQSACIRLSRPMSPMPQFSSSSDDDLTPHSSPVKQTVLKTPEQQDRDITLSILPEHHHNADNIDHGTTTINIIIDDNNKQCDLNDCLIKSSNETIITTQVGIELNNKSIIIDDNCGENREDENNTGFLQKDISSDTIVTDAVQNNMAYLAQLSTEFCGFPLSIFTKGYLCLPYLSLPYLDLLCDVNVRGYVVGATNILFKQKTQLYDVLVDIELGRIECQDLELRKQLHLTTEDLRFADYIVKHVSDERHDVFLDGVGWEGGDEWIRTQFRIYLLCLLRTSTLLQDGGGRDVDHFNASFIANWKNTSNYKTWAGGMHSGILDVNFGHPFAGQLSVADMKLRLAHTMQNTDSGRKLNQAMASTGRAVATTSKAVGGAISQAKGALSSWWTNLLVNQDPMLQQQTVTTTKADEILSETDLGEEPTQSGDLICSNTELSISVPQIATNSINLINGSSNLVKMNTNYNDNNGTDCIGVTTNDLVHQRGEIHTV